jgi:hypothetical protein
VNPATELLRRLAEAGATDTCPCPCDAQVVLVEVHPAVFVITYAHDDWCPRLGGSVTDQDPTSGRVPRQNPAGPPPSTGRNGPLPEGELR